MKKTTYSDLAEVLANSNITTTTLLMYLQGLEHRILELETTVQIQQSMFLARIMDLEGKMSAQMGVQIGKAQENLIKALYHEAVWKEEQESRHSVHRNRNDWITK